MSWVCLACGHVYNEEEGDPDHGIAPGTKFTDLPDDWECSFCGSDKQYFAEVE